MSEEKPKKMAEEFKALLEKYSCEAVLSFTIDSADKIGWTINFRDKAKKKNAGRKSK